MKASNLLKINPRDYDHKMLAPDDILPWFSVVDAYWEYEGEPSPEKPHAELTSGLCCGGYFDVPRLLKYPNITEILGSQLVRVLRDAAVGKVDWVVSSAYAAITIGHEVAKALGAICASVEKDPSDPGKKRMLWQRLTIPAGARVLQVEELITTTGTLEEVRRAVTEGNAEPVTFLPTAGTLILRPEKLLPEYGDRRIIGFVEREIQNFKPGPDTCPYCAVGSVRYRPKTHWKELTGKG